VIGVVAFGALRVHREVSAFVYLTPSIDRSCPLEGVPNAMRHLEAGQVRGKLAITLPHEGERS
jgi:hypothetical protein